jgi:TrmH family RNA methyltransferase
MKALVGSRGKKARNLEHVFVADGLQSLRAALFPKVATAPLIERLYFTDAGFAKVRSEYSDQILDKHEIIMVTDQVMAAMADTESPQGILALCKFLEPDLGRFADTTLKKIAYFWQIQDPGNAGTAIRAADACGFDLVMFSDLSVDIFSPKVVRSTAGSLWNIPIVQGITLDGLEALATERALSLVAFYGESERSIETLDKTEARILIFGNEGRGLPDLPDSFERVSIPMHGHAESFNVASAASIAMYVLSN